MAGLLTAICLLCDAVSSSPPRCLADWRSSALRLASADGFARRFLLRILPKPDSVTHHIEHFISEPVHFGHARYSTASARQDFVWELP